MDMASCTKITKEKGGEKDGCGMKAFDMHLLALPPNSVVSPSMASLPPALQK
jgi:hypothetical protein